MNLDIFTLSRTGVLVKRLFAAFGHIGEPSYWVLTFLGFTADVNSKTTFLCFAASVEIENTRLVLSRHWSLIKRLFDVFTTYVNFFWLALFIFDAYVNLQTSMGFEMFDLIKQLCGSMNIPKHTELIVCSLSSFIQVNSHKISLFLLPSKNVFS